jgi:DNA modification methylase
MTQTTLFPMSLVGAARRSREGSFVDNMRLPVHRWFRYSAGFSAQWVEHEIKRRSGDRTITVLDPFAGSGTTLIAAGQSGVESIGVEAHPFIARVAAAKLLCDGDASEYLRRAQEVLKLAVSSEPAALTYPTLIHRCYAPASLDQLDRLRRAYVLSADGSDQSELVWLTLVSILRVVSTAGTAPWQYVLPNKSKAKVAEPFTAFSRMSHLIASDMEEIGRNSMNRSTLFVGDARSCSDVCDDSVDLVLTSPPYANNYDYADATRLEMSFMGEISGWADLQAKVRMHLVRSCSQHVPMKGSSVDTIVSHSALAPIRDELLTVCRELAEVRLGRGGRKTYHLMVASYMLDMAQVWLAMRRVTRSGGSACFVIGDSAPYGVYVPVVNWLGRLAVHAGFDDWKFEKIRDRNVKWKNRKHRVPLVEGRLVIAG